MKLARRNEPEYFLRLSDEAPEEGPFSIEDLREKAAAGAIARETWFRRADDENYRQLGDDKPLTADLWPDAGAFNPEDVVAEEAGSRVGEDSEEDRGDVGRLLEENIQRERAARGPQPAQGFDWSTLTIYKWVFLRWGIALALVSWGARMWRAAEDAPGDAFIGIIPIAFGVVVIAYDLTRFLGAPITAFFQALLEGGSGGGSKADFWTADKLMEQGEYRLAMGEYRRIVLQHPREIEAYLKGIRAARALDNQKEVERFRDLALKNLKSEQDRNLFLNSLNRME